MVSIETTQRIQEIKNSIQYRLLTPEIKVLIELYPENQSGLHVNAIARKVKGQLSKTSVEKAIMRLDDQGLVKTRLGTVHSGGAERLARICTVSGEITSKYIENLVNAIYLSVKNPKN